jgi:protein-disulfide isomerase
MAKSNYQHPERDLIPAVSDDDHWQGNSRASITLVEYGDYQCSYCATAHPAIKAVQEKFPKDLKFVFRNFPLTNIHPAAQMAAEAAEAAGAQGKFWEMHDLLYENQSRLSEALIAEAAEQLGLDVQRLLSEIKEHKYLPRIRKDFDSGAQSGVNGTPGFFLNGFKYDQPYDVPSLTEAVRSLLQENRWQTP